MSIAIHTPGDWQVSKHGTPEYAPQYGIHAGGNDFCIVKGPNAKADAELIAAAPKLLSACHDLLEIVEAELADDPEPDDLPSWHRAIKDANEAIQLAQPEQEPAEDLQDKNPMRSPYWGKGEY